MAPWRASPEQFRNGRHQQARQSHDEGNQRQRREEVQVQRASVHAQQDAGVDQHGAAGQVQRQPVQRLAATQQRPGQPARCGEIKHDGEQGEDVNDHSREVSHTAPEECSERSGNGSFATFRYLSNYLRMPERRSIR